MQEFYMKVAGVTFEGRQRIVRKLRPGDTLRFVAEPHNQFDDHAVAVYTQDNQSIGYIPRGQNRIIYNNLINNKGSYSVTVSAVTGGGFGSNYGCNMRVVYSPNCNHSGIEVMDSSVNRVSEIGFDDQLKQGVYVTCVQCQHKVSINQDTCPYCGTHVYSHDFDDLSKLDAFTAYLASLDAKAITDEISSTYKALKGSFIDHPRLGYNGCIVFAELILFLNYLKNQGPKNARESIPALLFAVGLAFVQCGAKQFDDTLDGIINGTHEITLQDWNMGYCFLKSKYNDEINRCEFSDIPSFDAFQVFQKYMDAVVRYKSDQEAVTHFERLGMDFSQFIYRANDCEPLNKQFRCLLHSQISLYNSESYLWANSKNRASEVIHIIRSIANGDANHYKRALLEATAVTHARELAIYDYLFFLKDNPNIVPSEEDLIRFQNNSKQYINIQTARDENNYFDLFTQTGLRPDASIREYEIAYMRSTLAEEILKILVVTLANDNNCLRRIDSLNVEQIKSDLDDSIRFDDDNYIISNI